MEKEDREFEEWFDSYSPPTNPVDDLAKVIERVESHSSQMAHSLSNIEDGQRTFHADLSGALAHGALARLPEIERRLGYINTCLFVNACALVYIAYKLSGS